MVVYTILQGAQAEHLSDSIHPINRQYESPFMERYAGPWCSDHSVGAEETHLLSHGDQKQQQNMCHTCKFTVLVSSISKCCLSDISICNFYAPLPKVKSQLGPMEQEVQNKPAKHACFQSRLEERSHCDS